MTTSKEVRERIARTLRRDLIGPGPDDADLEFERLRSNENPSRWYLTGFIAPAEEPLDAVADDPLQQEEMEHEADTPDVAGSGGAAGDNQEPDAPNTKRRFLPSSMGLTVLLPTDVKEIEVNVSWGDYRTEPPLPESILIEQEEGNFKGKKKERPAVEWVRIPRKAPPVRLTLDQPPRPEGCAGKRSRAAARRRAGTRLSHARFRIQNT